MAEGIIRKPPGAREPAPLLRDYAQARAAFSWEAVARELGVPLAGPLNVGELAVSRGGALAWFGAEGRRERFDAPELARRSGQVASALRTLGAAPGDRVAFMTRAVPELAFGVLGALRAGLVPVVLARLRNPEALRNLLERTGAGVAVLEPDARAAVETIRHSLPALKAVLVLQTGATRARARPGETLWEDAVAPAPPECEAAALSPDQPAWIQYSDLGMSGAVAAHRAAFALANSAALALDLRAGDGFAALSVPGDTIFVPYALLAPLLLGATACLFEEPAKFAGFADLGERVDVWLSAVRAIDVVLRNDPGLGGLLERCRHLAVTHPYDPAFVEMTQLSWGSPLHPVWFPREMGTLQAAEFRAHDLRLGSIGRPLPGTDLELDAETGRLAIRLGPGAPFAGYWGDPEMTDRRVKKGWFVSDVRARMDPDGYAWIVP